MLSSRWRLHIEIDQSGKIENTRVDTVLAFADGESYAILIPAVVKRACLYALRRRIVSDRIIVLRIFAAGLYLLLQDVLPKVALVIVDDEYLGRGVDIRGMLLRLVWAHEVEFRGQMVFRRIGKKSPAHFKAHGVYRSAQKANHVVTIEEVLPLL